MGFTKEDIKDVLEMVILSVVAMLVLLIVVRPFLNKIMQPIGASIGDGGAANAMLGAPAGASSHVATRHADAGYWGAWCL
jgi:flagellar biosynthesis/type III secretory pathway M-ring protein FliF/YscJ